MSTFLKDALSKSIDISYNNKANINKFIRYISDYYDKNSEILFTPYPTKKLFFMDADKAAIYTMADNNPIDVKKVLKDCTSIDKKWKIMNDPLNITIMLILRKFIMSKDDINTKAVATYMSCHFYSSMYHKYFEFGANEQCMKYTVNNMTDKFKLKVLGSVYKNIEATAMKCVETYHSDIITGSDEGLIKVISAMQVRINDLLKNIKREFMKNHTAGNYMHTQRDVFEDDNVLSTDSGSYKIKKATDSTITSLNNNGADMRLASLASSITDVSKSEICNVINRIVDNELDGVENLVSLILEAYVSDGGDPDKINTKMFLAKGLEIYKKSNTTDRVIIEIKNILNTWLMEYSDKYKRINRPATLNNFKKAIFIYFVLHIQIKS